MNKWIVKQYIEKNNNRIIEKCACFPRLCLLKRTIAQDFVLNEISKKESYSFC